MARHRSSAVPLAWLYAALIVYASLFPFTGWRASSGPLLGFLTLPWPRWWTAFDLVANLLGYLPLGLLLCVAWVRNAGRPSTGFLVAVVVATLFSGLMESLQNFLPRRVPSNVDLIVNVLGTAIGAGIGLAAHSTGLVAMWSSIRNRWFVERSSGGLAVLLVWPLGLLFPAPVVLGLGQILGRVQNVFGDLLVGTPLAESADWLGGSPQLEPLTPGTELIAVTLGLLAPCLVAFTFTRPGWRRLVLVLWVASVGFAATTLSTALNFGPQHALAWTTWPALVAFVGGMLLASLMTLMPSRLSAGLGLVVLTALVLVLVQAPGDPYYFQSLQRWEQGKFIHFHGAAQWVGWMWPYAAILYLLFRIGATDRG